MHGKISFFCGLLGISVACSTFAQNASYQTPDQVQTPPPSSQPYEQPFPMQPPAVPPPPTTLSSGILEWVPPALTQLSATAAFKTNFTLDRTMLAAAMNLYADMTPDTRQAASKIDGASVHILRFGHDGIPNEEAVDAIRQAYHLRGWKHLVATNSTHQEGYAKNVTDLWLVMDGMTMRGAVALFETPRSITLVSMAGNLNPVDILHLRGRFGIPKFEGDEFKEGKNR